MLKEEEILIKKVRHRMKLMRKESEELFEYILKNDSKKSNMMWGALFTAMMSMGCDIAEIMGLVSAVEEFDENFVPHYKDKKNMKHEVFCITGSGKEDYKTVNISTMAAMLVAAVGYKVLKPASTSVSATCGSLDIIQQFNLPIANSLEEIDELFDNYNFVAFDFEGINKKYASRYGDLFAFFHPLSYIMPALAIPVKISRIVYGVADNQIEITDSLMKEYGYANYLIVTGNVENENRIDEFYPSSYKLCGVIDSQEVSKLANTIYINPKDIIQKDSIVDCRNDVIEFIKGNANESIVNLVCINAALLLGNVGEKSIESIYNELKIFVQEKKMFEYYKKYLEKMESIET